MEFKLDLESIKKDYKYKTEENIIANKFNLTHSQCNRLRLLPYAANDKKIVLNFEGVIGELSRIICDKKLKNKFNVDEFIENVSEEIEEFKGENSKQIFKEIIKTIFVKNDKLTDFNIKTMNYVVSYNSEEKYAMFLFSIFFDEEIKKSIKECYMKKEENILNRLVLKALSELINEKYSIKEYKCYIPYIKEVFKKDVLYLIRDEELYKDSIKRLLEYYNFFYVSQLCFKLNEFENAEIDKIEPLYFTLSWETTSKNRTAYKFGYEKLKDSMKSLFSHAITLELLNHNNLNKQLGYRELVDLLSVDVNNNVSEEIKELIKSYKERVCDKNWSEFRYIKKSEDKVIDAIHELFETIEFQFVNSGRSRAYEAYRNWFKRFVEENFGKRRGALGYNLNLTEEDIILLTKICINVNEKLRVNVLFGEFEKRGVFLDRDSKNKVIQLYEKLNILEKKSDSGDAQYVRSIL